MRLWFPVLVALIAASPAPAQDRPKLHPTRDVEVEYRTTGMPRAPTAPANPDPNAGAGGALTMHFTTKGNRLRIEGMNGRGYAIIDKDAGRMIMVMTERKMYIEMPRDMTGEPNVLEGLESANATFKKIGTEVVAGLNCTTYETSTSDHKGKICLTDDGVWLRAASDDPNHRRELEAVKVTYTDQPASLFEPPAGFQKMEMPTMPSGMPPVIGGPQMGPRGMGPGGGMPGVPPAR